MTSTAVGRLAINGGQGVRADAALPGVLRALPGVLRSLPGVRTVRLALAKPWIG